MMKNKVLLFLLLCFFSALGVDAAKANNLNVDQFFRPVKKNDLFAELPPRIDQDKNFDEGAIFSSRTDRCPSEISIGSVDENTDIFGDVNIEVFIQDDVIINCGR